MYLLLKMVIFHLAMSVFTGLNFLGLVTPTQDADASSPPGLVTDFYALEFGAKPLFATGILGGICTRFCPGSCDLTP